MNQIDKLTTTKMDKTSNKYKLKHTLPSLILDDCHSS